MRTDIRLHLGADRISSLQGQNRPSLMSAFMIAASSSENRLSLKAYQNIRYCQRDTILEFPEFLSELAVEIRIVVVSDNNLRNAVLSENRRLYIRSAMA
ncbi:MAG: hypothetical protein ABSA46_02015 [Thermodesulfovibrionales bacterium]|jgi:hypothetical protein